MHEVPSEVWLILVLAISAVVVLVVLLGFALGKQVKLKFQQSELELKSDERHEQREAKQDSLIDKNVQYLFDQLKGQIKEAKDEAVKQRQEDGLIKLRMEERVAALDRKLTACETRHADCEVRCRRLEQRVSQLERRQ